MDYTVGAFADACSACNSPLSHRAQLQYIGNAQYADAYLQHGDRLAAGAVRASGVPAELLADIVQGSMALTNTLSISAAGPSIDFRVPDTLAANLVPVAISPSNAPMSPISTPAAAGAGTVAADRPWRSSNNAGMPHSPLVAPAQQLFTTPAAAAGARGIPGAPRQRQQQVQRFAFISPGESVRSELSTDTDMGNGLCAGLNGAGSAGTASRCA